jgi:glycosyltransferase involved in cell wall biosynthesis
MRIGVYIEHGEGNGVGGAELMMAFLASAWSRAHDVDLVHHRPPLTRERLSLFSTDDYSRVTIRAVPREPEPPSHWDPVRRYRAAREWQASLSEPYDLFVDCTHWRPPFSHARRAVLLVLFPFYTPPWRSAESAALPWWKQLRHETYHEFEWRRRLGTYDRTLAISRYAAEWTHRRWGVAPEIVHPPVDVAFERVPKDNLIVSVGRYSTMAHTKKQLEMVRAFVTMDDEGLAGWQYACLGGLNARAENHAYFAQVKAEGAAAPVIVEANVPRARVRDLLARGRVFWHATGLGEDEHARPELAEHFGIATVEAMAAGCVPVVINRGGQSEIVSHGRNGFLWNTLDEMKAYTRQLVEDPALWAQLSDAARRRAADFTRARFLERMSAAAGLEAPAAADAPAYLEAGR